MPQEDRVTQEQPWAPLPSNTTDFSTVAGHREDRGQAGNQSSDAQHSMQSGAEEALGSESGQEFHSVGIAKHSAGLGMVDSTHTVSEAGNILTLWFSNIRALTMARSYCQAVSVISRLTLRSSLSGRVCHHAHSTREDTEAKRA